MNWNGSGECVLFVKAPDRAVLPPWPRTGRGILSGMGTLSSCVPSPTLVSLHFFKLLSVASFTLSLYDLLLFHLKCVETLQIVCKIIYAKGNSDGIEEFLIKKTTTTSSCPMSLFASVLFPRGQILYCIFSSSDANAKTLE